MSKDLFAPADQNELRSLSNSDQSTPNSDNEENVDYFAALVGEGKKYKDAAALGKAAVHKDKHIETLEEETRRLRNELQTRMSLEDFYNKTRTATSTPTPTPSVVDERANAPASDATKPLTMEQISDLVRNALKDESAKNNQERNLRETRQELIKLYGEGFDKVVKTRADELGLSPEFVNQLASTSPKAVVSLLGGKAKEVDNSFSPPMSNSTTPLSHSNSSNVRDNEYYDRLRKQNPKDYWSTRVQAQKHKDALALGDRFFSSKR